MAKQNKKHRRQAEFYFWLHTVILLVVLISGLFISFWWVALILVLIKLQQRLFHGCIITIFEIKSGGIKKGHAYFQLAARRFAGLRVGNRGVQVISNSFTVTCLLISLVAAAEHFRIHL